MILCVACIFRWIWFRVRTLYRNRISLPENMHRMWLKQAEREKESATGGKTSISVRSHLQCVRCSYITPESTWNKSPRWTLVATVLFKHLLYLTFRPTTKIQLGIFRAMQAHSQKRICTHTHRLSLYATKSHENKTAHNMAHWERGGERELYRIVMNVQHVIETWTTTTASTSGKC